GEHATIGLKMLTGTTPPMLIQNSSGVTVAVAGAGTGTFDRLLNDFVAPTDGPFYAVVAGGAPATFSLVVTNAWFDQEPNDSFSTAQNIDNRLGVVGYAIGQTPLDSFETGVFNYTFTGSPNGFTNAPAAHDGTSGLQLNSGTSWMFRTDAAAQVKQGDEI